VENLLIQKRRIAALDKPSRFSFTDRPDPKTPFGTHHRGGFWPAWVSAEFSVLGRREKTVSRKAPVRGTECATRMESEGETDQSPWRKKTLFNSWIKAMTLRPSLTRHYDNQI